MSISFAWITLGEGKAGSVAESLRVSVCRFVWRRPCTPMVFPRATSHAQSHCKGRLQERLLCDRRYFTAWRQGTMLYIGDDDIQRADPSRPLSLFNTAHPENTALRNAVVLVQRGGGVLNVYVFLSTLNPP